MQYYDYIFVLPNNLMKKNNSFKKSIFSFANSNKRPNFTLTIINILDLS